jgi:hypothetical protein
MKSTVDILFNTDRFNLSEEMEHFINPCCFGEDFAKWLRERLAEAGVEASEEGQEDWGWYLDASKDGASYFVGVGGESDGKPGQPNFGGWRVMIERKRSMKERLLGRNLDMGPLPEIVLQILRAEPSFVGVRTEMDTEARPG